MGHSALAPENLTTLAHFSVSSAINFPNSVGVIGMGSAPRPLIRALSCGSARPAVILLLSLSMIAAGVPLGARLSGGAGGWLGPTWPRANDGMIHQAVSGPS
jgi:hypothetical protein